jgi:hypothetical protein
MRKDDFDTHENANNSVSRRQLLILGLELKGNSGRISHMKSTKSKSQIGIAVEVENMEIHPGDTVYNDMPKFVFDPSTGTSTPSILKKAQIYMICSRNRLRLEPCSFPYPIVCNTKIGGKILEAISESKQREHKFLFDIGASLTPFKNDQLEIPSVTTRAPFSNFYFTSGDYELQTPLVTTSAYMDVPSTKIFDLKVEYIGQSQIKSKSCNTIERLKGHSSYQKILSNLSVNEPNREIVLIFIELKLSPMGISTMLNDVKEQFKKMKLAYETPTNIDHLVTLTEACLINYFKPDYNADYKKELTQKVNAIEHYGSINVTNFLFGLDSKFYKTEIYSPSVPATDVHTLNYDFTTKSIGQRLLQW